MAIGEFFYVQLNGFDIISCSVEYLHFGGRKAAMLKAEGRREEKVQRDKVFL
ncbi:MAG: hypothetical protein F6K17_34600 [Okeania sp. SIO3C4]|nr:hypothetical protein [Okeania sp. SIO3C4]